MLKSQDPWADSTQSFYDQSAIRKVDEQEFLSFVKSYSPLIKRFPFVKGATVLDLGCGSGILTKVFQSHAKSVVGIDLSKDSLSVARQKNPGHAFLHSDMTAIPVENGSINFALAITSLEFCADKRKVLAEVSRCLDDQGNFYLEVRNLDFLLFQLPKPIMSFLEKKKILTPYPAPGFKDLSFQEWTSLLEEAGFRVLEIHRSLRPWNYGGVMTKLKNLLIKMVSFLAPLRRHYMVGFLCKKITHP